MKKLLLFVLLFTFILSKANLRGEETVPKKEEEKETLYEGSVEVPQGAMSRIYVTSSKGGSVKDATNDPNSKVILNSLAFWNWFK